MTVEEEEKVGKVLFCSFWLLPFCVIYYAASFYAWPLLKDRGGGHFAAHGWYLWQGTCFQWLASWLAEQYGWLF
jgi:hypothetical protein